jgi:hypothetical protein
VCWVVGYAVRCALCAVLCALPGTRLSDDAGACGGPPGAGAGHHVDGR